MGGENDTGVDVCFSIPQIITTQVQCSFGTYFFEMYQTEFGWSEEEYGKIPTLYDFTQLISYILLGVAFNQGINQIKESQPDEAEKVNARLDASKAIEVVAVFFHWLTYFLLIILPIKWHGVKTPYVDSLFSSTSKFWYTIFNGPVSLSNLIPNKFLWFITCSVYFPFRMCWTVLYIPMKIFYLIVVNFGAIAWVLCFLFRMAWFGISWPYRAIRRLRAKNIPEPVPYIKPYEGPKPLANPDPNNILIDYQRLPPRAPFRAKPFLDASAVPDPLVDFDLLKQIWDVAQAQLNVKPKILPVLETLESIPPPTCSACCNTTCCNNFAMRMRHARQFMGTRTFWICFLVFCHAIGVSTFELSDKAITTYIYTGAGPLGEIITVNTAFFTVSNVVIIFIFSMVKFFSRSKTPFSEAFYLLAIIFLILQLPIMPTFFAGTKRKNAVTATGIKGPGLSVICLAIKALCLTVFHGTVFFWIFTGGPMTTYVAKNILDNHRGIWSFGVLTILAGFGPANWFFFAGTAIAKSQGDFKAFKDTAKMTVMGVSIAGQIFTYMVYFKHDWSWNTNYWINWLLIALTGAVNTYLVTYVYISIDHVVDDTRVRDYKWIINGCFFGFSHAVDSWGIDKVWKFYARRDTKHISWGCIQFDFDCSFHSVYKKMTIAFMLINIFFFGVYCFVHFVDQLIAALYKFADAAGRFQEKAREFQAKAGAIDTSSLNPNGKVKTSIEAFQSAAGKLKEAAEKFSSPTSSTETVAKKFKEFADTNSLNWIKLLSKAIKFRDSINGFKTKAQSFKGASERFVDRVKEFSESSGDGIIKDFKDVAGAFKIAADELGGYKKQQGNDVHGAAKYFNDFADALKTASLTDITTPANQFQQAAGPSTGSFKGYANTFYVEAWDVGNNPKDQGHASATNDLNSIKASFKAAADKFGEAANAFNDAAQAFSDILG